jgi:putative ABC transport system permease protein
MINPLPVIFAELRRSRVGVGASIGLIAVAVALDVAVTAQERALRQGSARAADPFDLLVGRGGSPTQLVLATVYLRPDAIDLVSGETLARLQAEPGAARVVPLVFGDSYRDLPVVGASADFVTNGGQRPLAEGRVFTALREVVVGASVPLGVGESFEPNHGRVEGDITAHAGFTYLVVGRMPRLGTPWDRAIVAPVEALWRVHARPLGHHRGDARIGPPWEGSDLAGASVIVVKPRSVADAYGLRARYRGGETMAVFPGEVLVELYGTLGDARKLFSVFALVTQALVIAAVLLAVFAVEAQRRRQLGILRALGASRAYVFAVVWLHVMLLVGSGAMLGLVLGWLGALGISLGLAARTGLSLPVGIGQPELTLVAALMLAGAALAALPAWRCYRHPASTLLRF